MSWPILILQTLGNPSVFSPNNALVTLARHLDRGRYQPVIAVPREGLLTEALRAAGAGIAIVPGLRSYHRHDAPWRLPVVALCVARVARRLGAALIVANHAELAPFARAAARLTRRPWICMLRQADRPPKYYRKYGVQRADAVAAVSEAALRGLRASLGESRGRPRAAAAPGAPRLPPAAVIPTGIDLYADPGPRDAAPRADLGFDPADCIVGMVGLRGIKRPDRLVRILGRLAPHVPRLRGLLVGGLEAAERERLQALAATCGAAGRLRFIGQRHDMERIYRAMDVYAHTSESEGLPKTVLEAMAAGLPVVGFTVGGIPEAVEDGVTGFLCRQADEEGFAARLGRLLSEPGLAERLGRAGRARVADRFSSQAMTRGMVDLFDRVLKEGTPGT